MSWSVMVLSLALQAGEPCEAPRVRDTAPLLTAIAQDKVMALAFLKAAGVCEERGDACDQARLECTGLLKATIERQQAFDENTWLRDMLLPYLGANYAMTRTFGPAAPAPDASCNVDVAALNAAAQRRNAQATRREALSQEYAGYAKWTQGQLQKCREQKAADEAKAAAAKAEADRIAAASAATAAAAAASAAAAEAMRQKQAQEAAAAEKARQDAERRAKDAADAQAQRDRDAKAAAEQEAQRRAEAERLAREEREKDRQSAEQRFQEQEKNRKAELAAAEALRVKEKEEAAEQAARAKAEAEDKARREKEEAERKAKEAEERRLIDTRDTKVAQQREYKERLVKDAEAALEAAKHDEIVKKQAALAAVDQSPAIAQAAVAEAARAEAVRMDAEKKLVEARLKADSIVIDDSHERSRGSALIAGGGAANIGGFGLGVLAGLHVGFWGDAPSEGMASGLELRLWGRYSGQVAGTPAAMIDALLTARYFFGPFGVGLGGSLGLSGNGFSTLTVGSGPSIGLMFLDTPQWRVGINGTWLPVGTSIDVTRFNADMEVSWRFLTFQLHGGSLGSVQAADGPMQLMWSVGGVVGLRASW